MTDTNNTTRVDDRSVTFEDTDVLLDEHDTQEITVELSVDAFELFRQTVARETYNTIVDDVDSLLVPHLRIMQAINKTESPRPPFVETDSPDSYTLTFQVGGEELRTLRSLVQDAIDRDEHMGFGDKAQELFQMVIEVQSQVVADENTTVGDDNLGVFQAYILGGDVAVYEASDGDDTTTRYRSTDTGEVYDRLAAYRAAELDGDAE